MFRTQLFNSNCYNCMVVNTQKTKALSRLAETKWGNRSINNISARYFFVDASTSWLKIYVDL